MPDYIKRIASASCSDRNLVPPFALATVMAAAVLFGSGRQEEPQRNVSPDAQGQAASVSVVDERQVQDAPAEAIEPVVCPVAENAPGLCV